jgi:tetratricopeptide (TPR) repeat protein
MLARATALTLLGAALAGQAAAQATASPPADAKGAAEWHVARGINHYRSGGEQAAIASFSEAIRLDPGNTGAWKLRGDRYFQLDRLDEALRDYDRAAMLDPWDQTHEMRALLHQRLGHPDLALADWDRAAELAPENGDYQTARCRLRAAANEALDVARAACDRAVQLLPDYMAIDALDGRALVALRQGRFQEAWTDFDKAVQASDGHNAEALYGRGLAALRLGREADGQADVAAAAALDPAAAGFYAGLALMP